jgi:cyclophilin family peptidyl-prolyl cis-trans isomerase
LRQVERESGRVGTESGAGSPREQLAWGAGCDRIRNEAGFEAANLTIFHLSFDISHLSFEAYLLDLTDNSGELRQMPNRIATIQTNKGTIKFELLEDDAPKTTENFRLLAEKGYYDGVIFHRCINGFMIQGGDPTGTGRGGASAWGGRFADEIDSSSEVYKRGYKAGTVAMANAGPNTNGSQFFIMHVDYPLPPSYTIFGRVTEGQDVVNAIATSKTDPSDRPMSEVKMEKVTVE